MTQDQRREQCRRDADIAAVGEADGLHCQQLARFEAHLESFTIQVDGERLGQAGEHTCRDAALEDRRQFTQQPRDIRFWDIITLTGVDLRTTTGPPGGNIPFTLHWESSAPITVDLTTFVHLLDDEGNVVAQLDWGPQDQLGNVPTSAWQPGRPVIDTQTLALPDDLPPGNYSLGVGWYYAPSGERLPVTTTGDVSTVDNVVLLGAITVEQ